MHILDDKTPDLRLQEKNWHPFEPQFHILLFNYDVMSRIKNKWYLSLSFAGVSSVYQRITSFLGWITPISVYCILDNKRNCHCFVCLWAWLPLVWECQNVWRWGLKAVKSLPPLSWERPQMHPVAAAGSLPQPFLWSFESWRESSLRAGDSAVTGCCLSFTNMKCTIFRD